MDAAISALHDVGFAGASAREIARRAGCHQSQVFYYFGSVNDLLLAALDAVSTRRLEAYRSMLASAVTLTDLMDAAQRVFAEDLDHGHVAVLVQMITGAQTVPELAPAVAERLAPWQAFAQTAVEQAANLVPLGGLVPVEDASHVLVAGLLGLELLASLTQDKRAALALFDQARLLAGTLTLTGPLLARMFGESS